MIITEKDFMVNMEMIQSEYNHYNVKYFMCPTCHKIYHATIMSNILYDNKIKSFMDGVMIEYKYMCPDCYDVCFNIDEKIIDHVLMCINAGIKTTCSCQGHVEIIDKKSGTANLWSKDDIENDDGNYELYPGCMIGLSYENDHTLYILAKILMNSIRFFKSIYITISEETNTIFIKSLKIIDRNKWDYISDPMKERILDGLRNDLKTFLIYFINKYKSLHRNSQCIRLIPLNTVDIY